MEEPNKIKETFLKVYDLAIDMATKANKTHREVFALMLEYIDVSIQCETKKEEYFNLLKKVGELKVETAILKAINEGKIFKG